MRKLYNEFFYIPKHGKIREKVMLTRVAMTIVIMVMCLAAMSITAYAYFSHNVTSGSNIIKAANFEANVSITITDSNNEPVAVTKDGKIQTAILEAGKYTIELTRGNSTADTGFCVITIGDKTYYTDQIGVDMKKDLDGATVKFYLWLSAPTKIEVLSRWGTSVYYGYGDANRTEIFIKSDDKLDLTTKTPSGESGGSGDTSESTGETTTPSTDTTTGSEPSNTTPSTTEPTGTSEPTESTTEPTTSSSTEPTVTEPEETTESTETRPAEETTGTTVFAY